MSNEKTYWQSVWHRFKKHRLGFFAFIVVCLFCVVGIYAPFLASSRPIVVKWNGVWYFPLFRYLFYTGFYTKKIDLFFNLLIFTTPPFLLSFVFLKKSLRKIICLGLLLLQFALFFYLATGVVKDPASDSKLSLERQKTKPKFPVWDFDLKFMNDYAKLNLILKEQQRRNQHERLKSNQESYRLKAKERWVKSQIRVRKTELTRHGVSISKDDEAKIKQEVMLEAENQTFEMPTLWRQGKEQALKKLARLEKVLREDPSNQMARAQIKYLKDRQKWLDEQILANQIMPLIRDYHWEEDAGGGQALNQHVSWWELTRINRKDLTASLIFGVRVSLTVGVTAVAIALAIGVPVGALAGYYGGKFDIVVSRLLEIWEAMPAFFMLLLVVAITQSKSIFIVVAVIGVFGWTAFSRYIRGEFFKQRNLSYVEACHALGFGDSRIIFSHILPNAIPPLLTLLPFAVMGAITSEAGLSFLGLGEEGSSSWGVLMDEGRTAFPGESYLLWPPAILLVILLVAIALVGDGLRDTLDPKSR